MISIDKLQAISDENTHKMRPADMGFSLEEIEKKLEQRAENGLRCYFYYVEDAQEANEVAEHFAKCGFDVHVLPSVAYPSVYYAIVQIRW